MLFPPGHPESTSEYPQRSPVLSTWCSLSMLLLFKGAQTGSARAGLIWIHADAWDPGLLLIPCSPGQFCDLLSSLSRLFSVPGPSHLQFLPNHPQLATEAQGNPQVGLRVRAVVRRDGQEEPTQSRKIHGHESSSSITAQLREKPSRLLIHVPAKPLQHIFPF